MQETREDKFKRLAAKRTNTVLEDLRILGNLSNRANYSYNEEEVRKIFRAIESKVKLVKSKFKANLGKNERKFKL